MEKTYARNFPFSLRLPDQINVFHVKIDATKSAAVH